MIRYMGERQRQVSKSRSRAYSRDDKYSDYREIVSFMMDTGWETEAEFDSDDFQSKLVRRYGLEAEKVFNFKKPCYLTVFRKNGIEAVIWCYSNRDNENSMIELEVSSAKFLKGLIATITKYELKAIE